MVSPQSLQPIPRPAPKSLIGNVIDVPADTTRLTLDTIGLCAFGYRFSSFYREEPHPLVAAEQCSITVGVVDGPARSGHGSYHGVCSTYLASQGRGDGVGVFAFVKSPTSTFRLPDDPGTPLIMVGPGTGLAPFRGFLQERAAEKARGTAIGKSIVFFGCRNPDQDVLYRDELEQFVQQGVTELFTAFSRVPGQKKTYVQDRIKENSVGVWQMIQTGAIIYVCSDAGRMAQVQQAFAAVYRKETGNDKAAADRRLATLLAEGHYRADVWGSS
ncbi:MAG TPA: hypothetical protein VNL16_12065 [Chloroflexota bacterium]|nr:hypothetical protein [Chloroflexota bacterium]